MANNDQDTGTTYKSQGHIKEIHRKSSLENEAGHGLKEEPAIHPKQQLLIKYKLNRQVKQLSAENKTKKNQSAYTHSLIIILTMIVTYTEL